MNDEICLSKSFISSFISCISYLKTWLVNLVRRVIAAQTVPTANRRVVATMVLAARVAATK